MSDRLRIAVVGHHVGPVAAPFVGGVEALTYYLSRWLAVRGHDVVLHAPAGSAVPGVEVRTLALAHRFSTAARKDVSMPPDTFMDTHHAYQEMMLELMRPEAGFDVVHMHSLHYVPVLMAPLLPAPSLLTLHTPPTPWLESALRARADDIPRLTAVSSVTARLWEATTGPMEVIENGVDLDRWHAGPGGADAVWSGRLVREKAPHLAIEAARAAGVRLRLAGPMIDPPYFSAEIAPRLADDVTYAGHLDHDELIALVGASGVAVVSSTWDEPFGLVAVEAMATGTPVAAFASGALVDVVDARAGRLADQGDVAQLADALLAARTLDRAAVRDSARRFGVDRMGARYEDLYRDAIAESAAATTLRVA